MTRRQITFQQLLAVMALLAALIPSAQAFYDSNLGRWLNRDPIEEEGGLNLYRIVWNNPVGWFDAFGHEPGTELAAAIGSGEAAQIEAILFAYEGILTRAQVAMARAALANIARQAAQKALLARCTKNPGKLAQQLNRTKTQIEKAIHIAKRKMQGFRGKGQKGNVDVTVDATDGEVYPEIPGGGLGDSIGNIFDILEELGP